MKAVFISASRVPCVRAVCGGQELIIITGLCKHHVASSGPIFPQLARNSRPTRVPSILNLCSSKDVRANDAYKCYHRVSTLNVYMHPSEITMFIHLSALTFPTSNMPKRGLGLAKSIAGC